MIAPETETPERALLRKLIDMDVIIMSYDRESVYSQGCGCCSDNVYLETDEVGLLEELGL